MNDRDKLLKEINQEVELKKERVKELLETADFIDDDGYPTESALEIIEKWHWDDIPGWFRFIEEIWHFKSWGWKEKIEPHEWHNHEQYKDRMVRRYYVSTGGWSGNESIIHAMKNNDMMWHLNWIQSRRGGHFIFEEHQFAD